MPGSLFQLSCRSQACNFMKEESLAQVSSYEFHEISRSTFSYKTPLVAASVSLFKRRKVSALVKMGKFHLVEMGYLLLLSFYYYYYCY